MKNHLFALTVLTGIWAAFSQAAVAQNACPDNPPYTYYHPVLDTFNTPVDSAVYWLHFKNEPAGTTFASPYYQGGSGVDNIWPLKRTVDKDNKIEDGWEVLHHDFDFTLNSIAS